tara:strand:+ start:10462 stop:11628 length:1167 start_codon:yes stop_codon:yes gene_type:complete
VSKLNKLYHNLTNVSLVFLFLFFFTFNTFLFAQNTNNQIKTIVIDPGHGGKDPGTMGTKRYTTYEKDVALSLALKLGNYISNKFKDIEIIYTRKKDVFLELHERTEIANNSKADLFISIHCDGFTNPKAYGASVFVMGMTKLKANLDVAMRENSAIYLEDNYQKKYQGFDPKSPESYIVFSLMQNTYQGQSLKIAEEVEKQFSNRVNRKSRGVKQAPFYVISRVNMPAVLIECGFLTNPTEEDFLQSEKGQDYLASAIFRAFRSYKQSIEGVSSIEDTQLLINNHDLMKDNIKKEDNKDLVFKVQIGTYLKSMNRDKLFIKIKAQEHLLNGTFKYYVGSEHNKNNAENIKNQMLQLGFKGAFVVAFYKEERITIQEALNLQKKILKNE